MDHVHELVAWAISLNCKGGDLHAQEALETILSAEDEMPHPRVQAVGPNDQVERTGRIALEAHADLVTRGLDLEHARIKLTAPGVSEADDDLVAGAYARAGLLWDITERVRLGVDYRYLFAQEFNIFDTDLAADYDQVTFSLGFAF